MSTADELAKLVALRDQGALSDGEFQAEKTRLLGSSPSEGPPGSPPGFVAPPPLPPTGSEAVNGGDDAKKPGGFAGSGKQVLIGLVVVAVIGAATGLGIALTGGSTAAGASEVFLQPTNAQGQNPFTPNVGKDASVPSTVTAALKPTSGTTLASYSGSSVGLYGGTMNLASCDISQMITYLQANPSKASAWAAAEGIPVGQISTYIHGLTPMTLRYDTRVTNHGYVNGVANAIPEILQAGQAVLVDSYGVPRARCYCGNPLTPPVALSGSPRYVGPQWTRFSPTTAIVVQQSTTVINNFTLINNSTGQAFSRPVGTAGTSDAPASACTGPSMPGVTVCTNSTTTSTTTTLPLTTTTGVAPLLGSAAWGQALEAANPYVVISGFGEVAPASINSSGGNAPGSYVLSITWSNWGAPQAMGQGQSTYVSDPNAPLSEATEATATVVAFDLGSCDGGPPAYQEVEWYFPQLGQTFDPTKASNACTGE